MPTQTEQLFLALLRSELTGAALTEQQQEQLTDETLSALYTAAQRHDLAHLLAGALEKANCTADDALMQKLKKARYMAVYRYEQIRYELESVCAAFGEAHIEYMPLKGSVLRAQYPEPWMRTSCDIDVLVKPQDLEQASQVLTDKLGYRKHLDGTHDISFFSPGGLHVELHYDTVEENRAVRAGDVLRSVWESSSTENGTLYRMSDAMFYFYHVAHMAKHIEVGGCGVRSFMDLWILNHAVGADTEGRAALLEQGGLSRFADVATQLSERWFSDKAVDEIALLLEEFILYGGVYGNVETLTAVQEQRRGSKWTYRLTLVFPPYRSLKYQYPVLERHAWLYPFGLVYRIIKKAVGKDRKRTANKLKQITSVDDVRRQNTAKLLDGLQLMSEK